MEDNDAQLQLKKRARRRLVGAIAFVSVVAVVLPMVMDHEPRQAVQDVEIRIPGQDEKPFAPKFAVAPVEKPADQAPEKPVEKLVEPPPPPVVAETRPAETVKDKPAVKPAEKAAEKPAEKSQEKSPAKADKVPAKPEKTAEKASAKPEKTPEKTPAKAEKSEKPEKSADKTADKTPDKSGAKNDDAKRAAAILAGQSADSKPADSKSSDAKPAAKSGEFLVLIGAFSNEANVKNLKAKLSDQGIKTFSEPLDTPQGKKTRLRAGPFASREAAAKALEKMQRIGVSGVVAGKQ